MMALVLIYPNFFELTFVSTYYLVVIFCFLFNETEQSSLHTGLRRLSLWLWCPVGSSLELAPWPLPLPSLSQTAAVDLTVSWGNLDREQGSTSR